MNCPCGSGKALSHCCQPILANPKQAPTAESLMRARYTAHVLQQVDFVLQTVHPAQRQYHDQATIETWMAQTQWEKLTIVQTTKGGAQDQEGWVWFEAAYRQKGRRAYHREYSYFQRVDSQWYFVSGQAPPKQAPAPKVARNAPCPCGSGKKYKRCCGQA